jgi:hypothetical protein
MNVEFTIMSVIYFSLINKCTIENSDLQVKLEDRTTHLVKIRFSVKSVKLKNSTSHLAKIRFSVKSPKKPLISQIQ